LVFNRFRVYREQRVFHASLVLILRQTNQPNCTGAGNERFKIKYAASGEPGWQLRCSGDHDHFPGKGAPPGEIGGRRYGSKSIARLRRRAQAQPAVTAAPGDNWLPASLRALGVARLASRIPSQGQNPEMIAADR
jgi:hypothetical protein